MWWSSGQLSPMERMKANSLRCSPFRARAALFIAASVLLAGLLFFKTRHLHRGGHDTCPTIIDVLKQDPRLGKTYLALESAALLYDIDSSRKELALFAPTNAAVTAAGWGTAAASALTHTLLFHIVPATEKVKASSKGTELATALGEEHQILFRPGPGGGTRGAMVWALPSGSKTAAHILETIQTCRGTVHVIDRVLRAPAEALGEGERPADQASADGNGADDMAKEPQDADAEIWDAARDRARAQGGAKTGRGGWQAARKAAGERVSLRLMSKRDPKPVEAPPAANARPDDLASAQEEVAWLESVREQEEQWEGESAEQEASSAPSKEEVTPERAAKALMAAEEAQIGALSAAEKAFKEVEALQLPLSGPKAQDWMSAAEYAVEGMSDARAAAAWTGPEVTLEQKASAAASAALLMAEIGLSQHYAMAIARTGDWASALIGQAQVKNMGTGKAWLEAAETAHMRAMDAASAAGSLASQLAAVAQAAHDPEAAAAAGADKERDPPPPRKEEKSSGDENAADPKPIRKKSKRQGPALTEEDFRRLDAGEDEDDDWEAESKAASQKKQRLATTLKSRGSRAADEFYWSQRRAGSADEADVADDTEGDEAEQEGGDAAWDGEEAEAENDYQEDFYNEYGDSRHRRRDAKKSATGKKGKGTKLAGGKNKETELQAAANAAAAAARKARAVIDKAREDVQSRVESSAAREAAKGESGGEEGGDQKGGSTGAKDVEGLMSFIGGKKRTGAS